MAYGTDPYAVMIRRIQRMRNLCAALNIDWPFVEAHYRMLLQLGVCDTVASGVEQTEQDLVGYVLHRTRQSLN